jgi:hypothetical protein
MDFQHSIGGIDVKYGYYSIDNDAIARFRTMCCALGQLSLNNWNTVEQIELVLEEIKKETHEPVDGSSRKGAERAIFVVTLPSEKRLEENLEKVGFKMIYEFHRRACYSEEDMLKLWIISW